MGNEVVKPSVFFGVPNEPVIPGRGWPSGRLRIECTPDTFVHAHVDTVCEHVVYEAYYDGLRWIPGPIIERQYRTSGWLRRLLRMAAIWLW